VNTAVVSDQWPVTGEQENPPLFPLYERGMKGGFNAEDQKFINNGFFDTQ
jgi:hypothetical protein